MRAITSLLRRAAGASVFTCRCQDRWPSLKGAGPTSAVALGARVDAGAVQSFSLNAPGVEDRWLCEDAPDVLGRADRRAGFGFPVACAGSQEEQRHARRRAQGELDLAGALRLMAELVVEGRGAARVETSPADRAVAEVYGMVSGR